jgi:beta-ribofuranosylaminobenzene 5'-phosphate synthase
MADMLRRPLPSCYHHRTARATLRRPFWLDGLFHQAGRFSISTPTGPGFFGPVEADFFLQNTPIPRQEGLDLLGILCHGVIPAFVIGDLGLLRSSLRDLAHVGFKRIEIAARGQPVVSALADLLEVGLVAAGMSSTGPMMYAIVQDGDRAAISWIEQIASRHGLALRGPYDPCNHGYAVEWDK